MGFVLSGKPGGGGGFSPDYTQRALYTGDPVTVANDATGIPVTWDTLGTGVEQLDRTDPESPTVLTAGIYSVTAIIDAQEVLTAGGVYVAVLHLDADGEDAVCEMTSNDQNPAGGQAFFAITSLNCTYYVPQGGAIRATVSNMDGAASRSYRLREAMIQRIL